MIETLSGVWPFVLDIAGDRSEPVLAIAVRDLGARYRGKNVQFATNKGRYTGATGMSGHLHSAVTRRLALRPDVCGRWDAVELK